MRWLDAYVSQLLLYTYFVYMLMAAKRVMLKLSSQINQNHQQQQRTKKLKKIERKEKKKTKNMRFNTRRFFLYSTSKVSVSISRFPPP